ncbi:hypothetical protein [Streptomyces hainanensis]|uniref:Uncharacterized protein n=1 Tax=Streptomyces hainanensis TaxID=402648 RepID=A0A4R4SWQ3_9ACTN|nr:hypothetical protein [Streptomyces hainanensis]TDC68597.1 hypothetical protein E1283_27140 [Streptomyces hainanensis]
MNNTFEDRLLAELTHEVRLAAATEAPPAPRRRVLTPARAGLGLATAGAAAASFLLLPGGGASPAYAVERQDDGRVVVDFTTYGFDNYDELLADLRAAGVTVIEEPERELRCADGTFLPLPEVEAERVTPDDAFDALPERVTAGIVLVLFGDQVEWPSLTQPDSGEVGIVLNPGDTAIHDTNGAAHSLGFFSGSCE